MPYETKPKHVGANRKRLCPTCGHKFEPSAWLAAHRTILARTTCPCCLTKVSTRSGFWWVSTEDEPTDEK